jgi:hypothetical protein
MLKGDSGMKRLIIGFCVIAVMMLPMNALATPVIDFGTGIAGLGGSVVFSSGQATGTGIPVGSVTITGAPANNGTFDTSGLATSSNQDANLSAALSFDTSLNTVTIIGGIPSIGIADGTTLLSGSFSSFTLGAGRFDGSGPDIKSEALLRVLGLPLDTKFEFFGFSLTASSTDNRAISTDFRNTAVPEPMTLLLLGAGLLGIGVLRRKN